MNAVADDKKTTVLLPQQGTRDDNILTLCGQCSRYSGLRRAAGVVALDLAPGR